MDKIDYSIKTLLKKGEDYSLGEIRERINESI